MKELLLIIFFCLSYFIGFGQDYHKIDSLKKVLATTPELNGTDRDTARMQVCLDIGDLYENYIPDSAIWWYSSVADTIFDSKKIKLFPMWSKQNATALRYIGAVAWYHSNYPSAITYFEKSLKIAMELGDKSGISMCLNNLGNVAGDKGNYPSAISYYERSLKIAMELGDKAGISRYLNNLGVVEWNQGNFPSATSYYERSLKINEELGDKSGISRCLNNLGNVAGDQGNYPSAISYYERSLKIKEELGDKSGISKCLNNLGIVEWNQGNYHAAISYYEKSIKIKEEIDDKKGISSCLMHLGIVACGQGNYPSATSYYEKSLKIDEELGDKLGISKCLMNLGIVERNQGNFPSATSYYERSLKIDKEIGDKSGIPKCLINLGMVANDQGNYHAAISYYESSLNLFEELGDKANLANYYPSLASAFIKVQTPEKALPLYLKSQAITYNMLKDNFSILSESEKELYLNQTKGVFNQLQSFNINYPEHNDSISEICYNNVLILKGLLLKSSASIMDVVFNSDNPEVKDSYFLLKQYRDQISQMQGTEEENRDSLIADLEAKANEQERKLVRLSSEFADIQKLFDYKWEDVQKNLKPGEAAIEFVSFTQGDNEDTTVYAALIVTPDCKAPVSVKLFEDTELEKIIGKTQQTGYKFISSLYNNSQELYNLIWNPMESALTGINTVYYAPVGVLNKISFAALIKESGKMLCDEYNLYQVSTTGKLINREESKEIRMTAAIFGGIDFNSDYVKWEYWKYLKGTLTEKARIERFFKKNKLNFKGFSGKEASEEQFKEMFAENGLNPAILHVSTHGFFYPDPEQVRKEEKKTGKKDLAQMIFRGAEVPGMWMFLQNKNPMMRSGLVFAGANKVWNEEWGRTNEEGVLTAYEVSNMNMRKTDLVVLSACETGLGDIKGSEGVYGLQRAFKMAGVKYIIMSLWQVPDKETVEFMETFYKKLLKTKDVRLSFNETQKDMRKKYDPYYWAAFVLVE